MVSTYQVCALESEGQGERRGKTKGEAKREGVVVGGGGEGGGSDTTLALSVQTSLKIPSIHFHRMRS